MTKDFLSLNNVVNLIIGKQYFIQNGIRNYVYLQFMFFYRNKKVPIYTLLGRLYPHKPIFI